MSARVPKRTQIGPGAAPARRVRRRLPTFLEPHETRALVDAAACERDAVIFLCGAKLGLRVSEIARLRAEDVDAECRTVTVVQGKGGKDRRVPVPPSFRERLAAWIAGREAGWLFPSPRRADQPLTTRALHKLVTRTAPTAGITSKRVRPHSLRHTYATDLIGHNVNLFDAKELMGHEKIETTARYLHVNVDRLRGAVAEL